MILKSTLSLTKRCIGSLDLVCQTILKADLPPAPTGFHVRGRGPIDQKVSRQTSLPFLPLVLVEALTFFDFQQRQQTILSPRSSIWNVSATFSFSFSTVLFTHSCSFFFGFDGIRAETTRYTATEVVTTNGTSCTHSLPESFRNPPNVEGIGRDLK